MKPKYRIGDVFVSSGGALIVITGVFRYSKIYGEHIYECQYGISMLKCSPYFVRQFDSDLDRFKKIDI